MSQKATILIVDDEPFNVDVLQQELEELNYQIITAANGQEALGKIKSQQPDLILLDLMMPVLDGFAVLSEIKADNNLRDIPVIIVSAADDSKSIVKGIKQGADDYITKPIDAEHLKKKVKEHLG
jgi:CheY-like chemotaxis protein